MRKNNLNKISYLLIPAFIVLVLFIGLYPFLIQKVYAFGQLEWHSDREYVEVPFRYNSSGHIVVDVLIGDKRYPFIVDSGGSNLLFEQYEIEKSHFRLFGFGLDANHNFFFKNLYKSKDFQLGSINFSNFTFGHMQSSFSKCFQDGVGILGKETLRHLVWQFLPEAKTIRIYNSIEDLNYSKTRINLPLIINKNGFQIAVEGKVNAHDSKSHLFLIDTGFNGPVAVSNDSSSTAKIIEHSVQILGKTSQALASSSFSTDDTYFSILPNFTLNKNIFRNVESIVSPGQFKAIGITFLLNYDFVLSWRDKVLILDRNNKNTRLYGYGFTLDIENETLLISTILENSKAFHLSLGPETKLLKVNKLSSSEIEDICHLRQVIEESDTLTIDFLDKGILKSEWFTKYYYQSL